MKASRVIVGGVDTPDIDTWPQVLWAYFSSGSLSESLELGRAYYRVLFAPSFDPEFCLTIFDLSDKAELSLVTYRTNLWYWGCYERQKRTGKWLPTEPTPPAPERWEEAVTLSGERVQQFWQELPASIPLMPEKVDNVGCDGMTMYCRFKKPGTGPQESRTWQDGEPGTYALAVMLYRLVSEVLNDPETKKVLDAVMNYGS